MNEETFDDEDPSIDISSNTRRKSLTYDGKNAHDQAVYLPVAQKFRSFCRIITPDSSFSWVYSLAVSKHYCPIQIINKSDYELRMRVIGITCGSAKALKIFDCELGKLLYTLEVNSSSYSVVNVISLSQPPKHLKLSPLLAAGVHTGQVYIYDVMTGLHIYEALSAYNHGGPIKALCIYEGERSIMIACARNTTYVWEFERIYRQAVIKDHKGDITSVCTLANQSSQQLTVGISHLNVLPSLFLTCDVIGIVNIYHIISCRLLFSFPAHIGPIYSSSSAISIDDDETRYFITSGNDCYIRIWTLNNITSSNTQYSFNIPYDTINGQLIDPKIGIDSVIPLVRDLYDNSGPVHAVTICYPIVISGGVDQIIRFWDINTGELIAKLVSHNGLVSSLAITLTPHILLISGSYDNTTRVWDLELSDRQDIFNVCTRIKSCREAAIKRAKNKK